MANKAPEQPPAGGEAAGGAAPAAQSASASGGIKAWMPLIVTMAVMPLLAYATTTFLLLPKLKSAIGHTEKAGEAAEEGESHGEAAPAHGGKEGGEAKSAEKGGKGEKGEEKKSSHGSAKYTVVFNKIIANIAQSSGTRYLMVSMTLEGGKPDFKSVIEENKDKLLDLALSTLGSRTIADLERPGVKNQIKSELISVFNNAIGKPLVQDIYFTEFATQ